MSEPKQLKVRSAARDREVAATVSIAVGSGILLLKIIGALITNSQAIFSDALESTVNVVAAIVAFALIRVSNRPADENHPYGHGKAEFFSASFEGGLVSFAALIIIVRTSWGLIVGHTPDDLSVGLILIAAASCANLALGLYLIKRGRALNSDALVASGHHAVSDFWTTVAAFIGVALTLLTGLASLDSLTALAMGLYMAQTGLKIVRHSLGGLLDEEDTALLDDFVKACNSTRSPGMISVHDARIMRSGTYNFIDAHIVVPEFWKVADAHDPVKEFATKLIEAHSHEGEVHFHIDPCRQKYCSECNYLDCPVRKEPFVNFRTYTISEISKGRQR